MFGEKMSTDESAFRKSKDCLVPKTSAGIAWSIVLIALITSASGVGIYFLADYLNRQHETRLNVTVRDFYLHLYKNTTDLGMDSKYQLGDVGFYFMIFDQLIWDTLKEYDNATDYAEHTNESLSTLIGSMILFQLVFWGDMNDMIDDSDGNSSMKINDASKIGVDNSTRSFMWGEDKVVLLIGMMLSIYNKSSTPMTTINFDPFDIIGESLNDTIEDNADFVNITKTYDSVAYFPSNVYDLIILGVDYDINIGDATKLYINYNGEDTTITDREFPLFFVI